MAMGADTISQTGGRQSTQSGGESIISAMPLLARDPDSVWARSAILRDQTYGSVETACRELGVEALVNKSIDFVYPAWVSIEAWLPAGAPGATHRLFGTFTIVPKPYSRFEFEMKVTCDRDGKKGTFGPFRPLEPDDIRDWVRYVLRGKKRPKSRKRRLRQFVWQVWYPANKLTRLGTDLLGVLAALSFVAAIVTGAALPFIAVPALIVAGICTFVRWKRRKVMVNAGRPTSEPRTLRLVDNWQTMANGLGRDWQDIRARLFKRLAEGLTFNIQSRLENISYLTPDGKQQREQLVLSQGRGIVYCHISHYGDDLFIGWDANLNYGQWVERALATGYDASLGAPAVINTVMPGTARITEYDLIDLSSLTEWVHSRMVQVVKQVMAEHKLDQDIDFKITRGERQSLLRDQEQPKRRPLSQPWNRKGASRGVTRRGGSATAGRP